jgi:hypothetical protein
MNEETKEESKVVLYITEERRTNMRTIHSDIIGDKELLKEYIKQEAIQLLQNL